MVRHGQWMLGLAVLCLLGACEDLSSASGPAKSPGTDASSSDEVDTSDGTAAEPAEVDDGGDSPVQPPPQDADGDGWALGEDCNDLDPAIHPGATERCNGEDDDCNGLADLDAEGEVDADGDGVRSCEDCNDADPNLTPGVADGCDGIDNDCDGPVDEDVGTITWYGDADGDGFGTEAIVLEDCMPRDGFALVAGDCDDADASAFPGHPEACDGADNDCDGSIDEHAAAGTIEYRPDADSDGFGDANEDYARYLCAALPGYVTLFDDCDDGDAAVHPGAEEACNGVDDDCDEVIDANEEDHDGDGYRACVDCEDFLADVYPGAPEICDAVDNDCNGDVDDHPTVGVATFYLDADGDEHGDNHVTTEDCEPPLGFVATDDDCDDLDASAYPGAVEICDGIDNDCDPSTSAEGAGESDEDGDGALACDDCDDLDPDAAPHRFERCDGIDNDCDDLTDEPDAIDAVEWHDDADGDGFGDPETGLPSCDAPAGYVVDGNDCDDADPARYPGAPEFVDGTDNDCDGTDDDATFAGTGADGHLDVTATVDLSTNPGPGRTVADAVTYGLVSIDGSELTVGATADGIVAGDEVLVINMHGSASLHAAVGRYDFVYVEAVDGDTITLTRPLAYNFGELSNADLADQTVVVQRVPNYARVTVNSGAVLTTSAWDGATGGIVAFRSSGPVVLEAGARIHAEGRGYAGGELAPGANCDGYQGSSWAGEPSGNGNGACAGYNTAYGWYAPSFGGGGAHINGGGGNHAGGATDSVSYDGAAAPAEAGESYGAVDLSTLYFGSGGGAVWRDLSWSGGPGGDGGGILFVSAESITALEVGSISAAGADTTSSSLSGASYGAGGGAGGSVWLRAHTLTLAVDAVDATGGTGMAAVDRPGGDGGYGRVRLDYVELNGVSLSDGASASEEIEVAEPDPGWSETPG